MTPQEVIKKFMASLDTQNYTGSSAGVDMLDEAVRASSRFNGIQNLIDKFLADHDKAESDAIKAVLGNAYKSEYDGKHLSDLNS